MPRAKKVLKEFVLDSDTDSATSKTKQEEPKVAKEEEVVSAPINAVKDEEVKIEEPKVEEVVKPKQKKPRKQKEPKKLSGNTNTVPLDSLTVTSVLDEPKKEPKPRVPKAPKATKSITQQPPSLTEAQMRAKIEKEYKDKEDMKTKIRRELEQELAEKQAKAQRPLKRAKFVSDEEDLEDISLGNDEDGWSHNEDQDEDEDETDETDEEEWDMGQTQIEKGNRKAPRAVKSVETMYKQIFG